MTAVVLCYMVYFYQCPSSKCKRIARTRNNFMSKVRLDHCIIGEASGMIGAMGSAISVNLGFLFELKKGGRGTKRGVAIA